jgi:flagellar motility protein MotE (MotC chaperone)
MIVTRQRKKPFPWRRVLLPLAAVALLVAALSWAPSRTWIATGPLAPLWQSPPVKALSAPLNGVAEQQRIGSQEREIASLTQQLGDARSQLSDRAKQISQLQTQLNAAQDQAATAQAAKPAAGPAVQNDAQSSAVQPPDLAKQATPDVQRTAQVWAAMDSEAAAKIVQQLPQDYVARVFAAMSPDAVGAILENLPASYAAKLTQEHPELKR